MRWRLVLVGVLAAALGVAGCGGESKLAPLRNDGTTAPGGAGTTPTTAASSDARTRDVLQHLVAVEGPAGYGIVPPDLDIEPSSLSPAMARRFEGDDLVWGMRRSWTDGVDVVVLNVYAFPGAAQARDAFECGCGGRPAPGVPGGYQRAFEGGAEVAGVAGSYLVLVDAIAEGAPPVGALRTIAATVVAAARAVPGGAVSGVATPPDDRGAV